jgi:AcrR family transcriptional regulator
VSTQAEPRLTEAEIVRAAEGIIEESGVEGLTVRRLSARLGVASGATYHCVPTKHALLVLVARDPEPRTDVPELQATAWHKVKAVGKIGLRRAAKLLPDVGLEVAPPTGDVFTFSKGVRTVRLNGEPIELLLYAFGRHTAAQVDISGNDDAAATLRHATWRI